MDILQAPVPSIKERADYLEICAHCMGIKIISSTIIEKYFIDDLFIPSKNITKSFGFIVRYEKVKDDYVAKQITKASPKEIQLIVDAMGLQFGE